MSDQSPNPIGQFTFPDPSCPCGATQLDPERLYCFACVEAMGIRMAEEMSVQRDLGIRGYIEDRGGA